MLAQKVPMAGTGRGRGARALRWAAVLAGLLTFILGPFALWERAVNGWSAEALRSAPGAGLAVLVAGLLAADVVLPVPSSVVSTASGALFGWALGAAVSWAGMTLGCLVGWALGRSAGRPGLRRFVGEDELARAEGLAARFGGAALALSRPVPVLAEASVLLAGACGVPLGRALWVTGAANLGVSLAYGLVGAFSARVDSFLMAFAGAMVLPAAALGAEALWRRRRAA